MQINIIEMRQLHKKHQNSGISYLMSFILHLLPDLPILTLTTDNESLQENIHVSVVRIKFCKLKSCFLCQMGPKIDKNRLIWAVLLPGLSTCTLDMIVTSHHCDIPEYITLKSS